MSDEDLERAKQDGVKEGKLISDVENHGVRLSRIEKGLIALFGAIAAAWAKSRGLW
jgi:hypothetical protein